MESATVLTRPADKPHSVTWKGMRVARFLGRWSSLLAGCHHPARAAYPELIRKRAVSLRRSGFGPCLALLQLGVAWPLHYGSAGGLLHHHFTLALAGGMFLWPCPAGSPEGSPPRALPGNLPCGVRTFLDADRSTPRPSGWPDISMIPSQAWFVNLKKPALRFNKGKINMSQLSAVSADHLRKNESRK